MKIIICGATGFVGRNLIPALLKEQFELTVVGRDTQKIKHIFSETVKALSWDELNTLQPDHYDAIINLAGENIGKRWTAKTKENIISSRVISTQKITTWSLKSKNKKPHIYNTSAIGVYGLQPTSVNLPEALTELSPTHTKKDFLSEVGYEWEKAASAAIAAEHPITFMRFAVVLKRHEGMLKELELPFSFGMGSIIGSGHQALSWIDIDDLIRAIIFLIDHPEITGAVNLCSPHAISQAEFAKTLAKTMHRPLFLKLPAALIKLLFGQMGKELVLGGQNIYPERLTQANFKFLYPDIQSALTHEWNR